MGRAHKMHAAPARQVAIGFQLVTHNFGNGQLGQGFFKCFLQTPVQAGASDQTVVKQGHGLAIGRLAQCCHSGYRIGDISTQRLQLFEQRGRGVPASVQPHTRGHEFLLH